MLLHYWRQMCLYLPPTIRAIVSFHDWKQFFIQICATTHLSTDPTGNQCLWRRASTTASHMVYTPSCVLERLQKQHQSCDVIYMYRYVCMYTHTYIHIHIHRHTGYSRGNLPYFQRQSCRLHYIDITKNTYRHIQIWMVTHNMPV